MPGFDSVNLQFSVACQDGKTYSQLRVFIVAFFMRLAQHEQ